MELTEKDKMVIRLRKETGLGFLDCRKALVRRDWDYDKARKLCDDPIFKAFPSYKENPLARNSS